MSAKTPAFVLGGTGYVSGELLRLLAGHPHLRVAAVLSDSQPGELVAKSFPHLAAAYPELKFSGLDEFGGFIASLPQSAVLAAAPHGVSAALLDGLLTRAEGAGARPRVVDISADYRYATGEAYERVYKHPHGAPSRLAQFTCALPEHVQHLRTPHVAHPGCFSTSILLASVPLLKLGLIEPRLFVTGVTGSTGSGRSPTAGTHHPQRHSDLYAYNALGHRHTPEITEIAANVSGVDADFCFVPHSGPFARGIHATIQASLKQPLSTAEVLAQLRSFYAGHRFVRVLDAPPRLKDVVTSNYAHLSAVADGRTVAVMSVVDNLTKGAAGGAVQWMNRLLGFDEGAGLEAVAPGWT